MEAIIKLNSQAAGRDKIARVIQYTSCLIWSKLQKGNTNQYTVEQIKRLESTCSSFRKLLRFGRCVDSFYSVLNTINYPDYFVRVTVSLSKFFNSLFLFADHILWLARSGFLKNADFNKWNDMSNKYWLFSIIMNLLRDVYEIGSTLNKERSFVFGASSLSAKYYGFYHYISILTKAISVVKLRQDVMTDTIKNACDIWLPLAALGRVKLQPGTIGLLGAISSLAGIIEILKPAAKLTPA